MKLFYAFLLSIFILPLTGQIIITEISYNPPETGTDSLEYIEIYNAGNMDFDLTGSTFSDGIEFTFENEVIESNAFMCIAINPDAMQNVFGKSCLQWTGGALRNGGEVIRLIDAQDNELDAVEYDTAAPWPGKAEGTDGNGASIVLCDYAADNSDGANWSAAKNSVGIEIEGLPVKGSPGEDNTISCEVTPDHFITADPDNTFTPADITINPGETVRWTNTGGFHNVNGDKATFPDNPESFGNDAPSSDAWMYDFTFFTEGVYQYQCDPHAGQNMKGSITVGVPKTYPAYPIGLITTESDQGVADSIGTTCEISGTVHGVNISTGGGLLFWIIDKNHDGISIFNSNGDLGYAVNEGDLITVRGEVDQFNGLTQLNADVIIVNGTGTLQNPIAIDSMGEANESKLVVLSNMNFVDPEDWRGNGSSFNIDITNGTYTGTMRISEFTDLADMPAPTGPFNLVGIVNQYDFNEPYLDFYQLMPRSSADIVMTSSANDFDYSGVSIFPNPSTGLIQIKGISNPETVKVFHPGGQLLRTWSRPGNHIECNDLVSGIYFLQILSEERSYVKQFILAK
jgi:plastocyanin